jgi:uncharacterized HhH-GPD family protein
MMYLATTPAANDYLTDEPLALMIGMLLDQQIPIEKAFTSPYVLRERLGHDVDAHRLASYDPAALETMFRLPPALHRFPAAMAKRVQALARVVVERYDGDVSAVWTGASDGADLVARLAALPGFGEQKARIFTALLGKQLGVRPRGWREAAGAYGDEGSFRSVADVVDKSSLQKVRAFKQEQKTAASGRVTDGPVE